MSEDHNIEANKEFREDRENRLREANRRMRALAPATEADLRDENERLQSELTAAKGEIKRLVQDNEHQRERRNAARDCINKMTAEAKRLREHISELIWCVTLGRTDSYILRKQAEAVDTFGQEIGVFDAEYDDQGYVEIPRHEVKAYAQRLRNQADELEKSGGTHEPEE